MMKTIEEKARAYDERLAKARKEYSIHEANNAIGIMDALERVFPELKESEDEKIRLKLIEAVKGDMVVGGTKDKQLAIAWLEKQGEQKPWSEEDENIKESIITGLEMLKDGASDQSLIALYNKRIDWLKSLKDRVQPKQGWSEEDCNQIETIACHLDNIGNGAMAESLLNIMDKYKSLRPKSDWKPSEEQVEALVSAIDVMIDNRGAGDKNTILLSGLYHELKAL